MPDRQRNHTLPGRAFHYRDTGSPLHRLGAGGKATLATAAGAAAIAANGPVQQALLLARIVHEGPTAAAHLRTLTREIDVRLLDVLPSTPPGGALKERVRRFPLPEHESAPSRYGPS